MTLTTHATSDVVAVAFIGGLAPFTAAMVATRLPRNAADGTVPWSATGFITCSTVGGTAEMYQPLERPVLQVDFWAANSSSSKPPLRVASQLANNLKWALRDLTNFQKKISLPSGYPQARVLSAYFLDEPREVWADASDYARYMVNMAFNWIEVTVP